VADKKVHIKVITPGKVALEADTDFVLMRTAQGDMGVLPGHQPYSVILDYGVLRTFSQKQPEYILAVMGGFATIQDDAVVVLTPLAEPPERLDEALAEIATARAENKLKEQSANAEMHRAETALRQMLVNMDVSAYSILKGKDEGRGGEQDHE
jgi:F-type H+-transporting ATPase subunit epsilon